MLMSVKLTLLTLFAIAKAQPPPPPTTDPSPPGGGSPNTGPTVTGGPSPPGDPLITIGAYSAAGDDSSGGDIIAANTEDGAYNIGHQTLSRGSHVVVSSTTYSLGRGGVIFVVDGQPFTITQGAGHAPPCFGLPIDGSCRNSGDGGATPLTTPTRGGSTDRDTTTSEARATRTTTNAGAPTTRSATDGDTSSASKAAFVPSGCTTSQDAVERSRARPIGYSIDRDCSAATKTWRSMAVTCDIFLRTRPKLRYLQYFTGREPQLWRRTMLSLPQPQLAQNLPM